MKKRKPLPRDLSPDDPRLVPLIELHARLAKQLGSVTLADHAFTKELRKEPGIRSMRRPERPGWRDLPEEELSLLEFWDRDAERNLPEAEVPLHEFWRGHALLSLSGEVLAVPLHPPLLRYVDLRDFYGWLPDYEKVFGDLPFTPTVAAELIAAFEPTAPDPELTTAVKQIAAALKQSSEAAAPDKDNKGKESEDSKNKNRLQRQIAQAIIARCYPNVAGTSTATVRRRIRKEWPAELRARNMVLDPLDPKYVKPPSYQTVHRMLGRDPKHR